jgi:cold shock CspA family protein
VKHKSPDRRSGRGTIKFVDYAAEYGFIIQDAGGEFFFAENQVKSRELLESGDRVTYQKDFDHSGRPRALNVARINDQ